jgi:hypothetical protein
MLVASRSGWATVSAIRAVDDQGTRFGIFQDET